MYEKAITAMAKQSVTLDVSYIQMQNIQNKYVDSINIHIYMDILFYSHKNNFRLFHSISGSELPRFSLNG